MNRRITTIFWLMTVCIVGINAFQAYWLWTTYELNRQQFSRTVQDALFQVLEQQQVAEARRLFVGKDKPTARFYARRDTQTRIEIRQFHSGERQTRILFDQQPADTLARRISKLVLLDWAGSEKVNLAKLTTAYRSKLAQQGIDAPFRIDTLTIRPRRMEQNVLVFQSTTANTDGTVRTSPLPINPVRNQFIQATFEAPTFYLVRRMSWLLGSSLLLSLLSTGCFLFMLFTILRQKKVSEIKSDFINNMTHELKTPIATVMAAVEALQHFGALESPKKTQTYLAISHQNLQRLSDLVEKVLNVAVEEKGKLVLSVAPVRLVDLVNELITNYQVNPSKPVTFDVDIPADAVVSVDPIHFRNAINNLIDNAIKYSGPEVHIAIRYQTQLNGWQLRIADNGIGISKAYHQAIFDRFFRVPTGNLHPVKGFGLGLSYVRQIVERHGGNIRVQSEPGRGSTFLIEC